MTPYMKRKPTKLGFKMFVMADSSNGYIVDFAVYANWDFVRHRCHSWIIPSWVLVTWGHGQFLHEPKVIRRIAHLEICCLLDGQGQLEGLFGMLKHYVEHRVKHHASETSGGSGMVLWFCEVNGCSRSLCLLNNPSNLQR